MKSAALLFASLSLLALAACSSGGPRGSSPLDSINSAPPDTDPGCYDHKKRLERTITTEAECTNQGWIWKPKP